MTSVCGFCIKCVRRGRQLLSRTQRGKILRTVRPAHGNLEPTCISCENAGTEVECHREIPVDYILVVLTEGASLLSASIECIIDSKLEVIQTFCRTVGVGQLPLVGKGRPHRCSVTNGSHAQRRSHQQDGKVQFCLLVR